MSAIHSSLRNAKLLALQVQRELGENKNLTALIVQLEALARLADHSYSSTAEQIEWLTVLERQLPPAPTVEILNTALCMQMGISRSRLYELRAARKQRNKSANRRTNDPLDVSKKLMRS